jgi:cardiolipin synthase A/B
VRQLLQAWPILLGLLAVVAAVALTVHVVLTKRNTSSAVAWVGLVWLSPVAGALAYLIFGINRSERRARELRGAAREVSPPTPLLPCPAETVEAVLAGRFTHLRAMARLGDEIAGRPLTAGNRAELLENGDQAFPAMLDAIRQARRSVTLITYIFDNDSAGRRFLEALEEAVARDVEVRVLIDDVGARYSMPSMVSVLRKSRVEVARFHPALIPWLATYLNLRNHRKILVVDGEVGFAGGINIREGNLLEEAPSHPVRDLHVRFEGPVVTELQLTFAEDWKAATGERLHGGRWFSAHDPGGTILARGISDGPDIDFEKLHTILMGALTIAQRRIRILTPYFIPDDRLLAGLHVAALRGVEVEVYLPEKGNLPLVQWASQAFWRSVLENRIRIFLTPAPFDHSKVVTVDEGWGLVGSANWDPRSLQLNFEFNVELFDPGVVGELDALVDRRRAEARELTLDDWSRRPLLPRLRDATVRLAAPLL